MKRKVLFRFAAIIAVIAGTLLLSTSCSNPAGGGGDPPAPPLYIITGSAPSSFTATRGGTAIPDGSGVSVTNLMTAIRTHAAGADITIQFGSGGDDVLDIGSADIAFYNNNNWGSIITLTGSITGSTINSGLTVQVGQNAPISIISTANISKTAGNGHALQYRGIGTLTINGGTISRMHTDGTSNSAIYIEGTNARLIMTGGTVETTSTPAILSTSSHAEAVSISGGTVQSSTGPAISTFEGNFPGVIRISGTAIIKSQNTTDTQGTIWLRDNTAGATPRLIMTGGQVINDADDPNARAINNTSTNGTMQLPAGHAGITGKVFERGTEITTD